MTLILYGIHGLFQRVLRTISRYHLCLFLVIHCCLVALNSTGARCQLKIKLERATNKLKLAQLKQ